VCNDLANVNRHGFNWRGRVLLISGGITAPSPGIQELMPHGEISCPEGLLVFFGGGFMSDLYLPSVPIATSN